MERRDMLKTVGTMVAAAATLPPRRMATEALMSKPGGPATIETEIVRLRLRHTWTKTM